MKSQIQSIGELHLNGTINSYAQIFFSQDRWYAVILLTVSMLDQWQFVGQSHRG